jgi:hypothetical protein
VERLVRENRVPVLRIDHAILKVGIFPRGSASHFFSKMPSAPFLKAPRH